jgi:hypothetical protein
MLLNAAIVCWLLAILGLAREILILRKYRRENAEFNKGQLQSLQKCNDALNNLSRIIEKSQEQTAKLAASQLVMQKLVDIATEKAKNVDLLELELASQRAAIVEFQQAFDVLKAEVDAKSKPNPLARPRRWAAFRDAVEGSLNA